MGYASSEKLTSSVVAALADAEMSARSDQKTPLLLLSLLVSSLMVHCRERVQVESKTC